MHLKEAIVTYPQVQIFQFTDPISEQEFETDVQPMDSTVLAADYGYFLLKAKNILPDNTVLDCYINLTLPERISDYAYQMREGVLTVRYLHEFEGEIICAVPISSFGDYELFYSRKQPEVGIEILRRGLATSTRKAAIADDLGYILRDERRFEEAAQMFEIVAEEGPPSYFTYGELARCYDETGNKERAQKYRKMFDNPSASAT